MFLSPHRRKWIHATILSVGLSLITSHLHAQSRTLDNVPEGPIHFYIEAVDFYQPISETSQLIVFYKAAYDHLRFIKEEGGYQADFTVVSVIYDRNGHQVTGDVLSGQQWVQTYDQTNSREDYIQGNFQFLVQPGDYRIRVWIEGQHSGAMVRTETEISVPSFEKRSLNLSALLLAEQILPLGVAEEGYERNGLVIVPSVKHSFSDQLPQMFCYFEIYDRSSTEPLASSYLSVFEILSSSNQVVLADTSMVVRQNHLSYAHRDFQVAALDEDQYLLRLTVRDPQNGRMAQKQTPFQVRWSALGQMAKDYEEAVEQLRYIATDEEYKELKAAQGEERKEVWIRFWDKRDPTPGTPANEMKIEYYRRIEYANANFSVVSSGWKTDRGRIYILYGPPDDIERHPMEIGVKPYQIWHYYSANRIFYFIDEDGYGDYKLIGWR